MQPLHALSGRYRRRARRRVLRRAQSLRHPGRSFYVRPLTRVEARRLRWLIRHSHDPVLIHRARFVLSSSQGDSAACIARRFEYHERYVRKVLHAFNHEGLAALPNRYGLGGKTTFTEEQREAIAALARQPPQDAGYPFTRWSLRKLRIAVMEKGIVSSIGRETLRLTLHEHDVTYQRTRTWKVSNDPDFEAKKARVRRLVKHPPKDAHVLATDEFGPCEIRPHLGNNWATKKRPNRLPATYSRKQGVQYLFAAIDLKRDKLFGHAKQRKRAVEWLAWVKYLRSLYPDSRRIYLIQDNLNTHIGPRVKAYCKDHNIVIVLTPTNASWLNPIECHFAPLKDFAIRNAHHKDKKEQARSMRGYIAWRNRHPREPKILELQLKADRSVGREGIRGGSNPAQPKRPGH